MSTIKEFLEEIKEESAVTRKMLERVPADKFDWQPHAKSMTMKQLTAHIADIPSWVTMAFNTNELDFQVSGLEPPHLETREDLLQIFEKSVASGLSSLEQGTEEQLEPKWILKAGDHVLVEMTRRELVRHSISQTIHHRAQLGVYLRLLDIPIPGTYGPSADEAF